MRIRDIIITGGAVILSAVYILSLITFRVNPHVLLVSFAILSTTPYFVRNSRLRFFGYFSFGLMVYWTIGTFLTSSEMFKDYFFILALGVGNATGAIISTIERSEHSYSFSVSAVAAYFSSFLFGFMQEYPDISTLIILLLVILSAIWVHFFQDLKTTRADSRDLLTTTMKTSLLTSPIFLLLLIIPSYVYYVFELNYMELGIVLFRYILLSMVLTVSGGLLRDFVVYLGGYKLDYVHDRAVLKKM